MNTDNKDEKPAEPTTAEAATAEVPGATTGAATEDDDECSEFLAYPRPDFWDF